MNDERGTMNQDVPGGGMFIVHRSSFIVREKGRLFRR